jgi:hypothetical protein
MTSAVEDLIAAARRLPPDEREQLLEGLLADLEGTMPASWHAAWVQAGEERLDELDRGDAHPVPWTEVTQRLDGA